MAAQESHRPIVLVVDDEPLIAQLVAETLAAEGYEIETARNGREALEKITLRSFDLILSDLRMPGLDGVGLYRGLEKGHPDTAVPVLHEPFNLGDLERFVQQLLYWTRTIASTSHPRVSDLS